MGNKYQLRNLTPKEMLCGVAIGCPTIYEVTPEDMKCGPIGGCSSIHEINESYLIVGEQVNPDEFGLAGKVGKNEVLIKVPKKLIDEKEK